MTGTIKASNNLVQTFSDLQIELNPTLNLNTTSYIKIDMPKSVQFQGPSCTVKDTKGFSESIRCNRKGYEITISKLFDNYFEAKKFGTLKMTVEEFLMPESV